MQDSLYLVTINEDNIPSQTHIDEMITPIESITFIGYPNGIWDEINLLPVVRQGTTATAYYYDFQGEPKFLIDASVFPGSSGSPVFIYKFGSYTKRNGNLHVGSLLLFIGIIAEVYLIREEGLVSCRTS